jgi:uncharacterized circularly permuted ATP-grasp superfamily protein/uncharacterized alpha-E superfamily protein
LPIYDELCTPEGEPRAHQQILLDQLGAPSQATRATGSALAATEHLSKLRRQIRERLTEQEVTYNILGAPGGSHRPWQLDVLPWVIDSAEFDRLSAGLAQRARLIDAVLSDLYGEQKLCRRGLVPPGIVLGNPHFWRSCHGWQALGTHRLHLYAADVGRMPDGTFVVFSDRTAAPTGSGYALENRLAMGRVLSKAFRSYPVRKLNTYFRSVRAALEGLAPRRSGEPRVVVLSAGVHDESSFEHAYLARYFGFELVEGRDLTVRDDVVYLKTLGGLKRVDVIWRRIFDDFCDPLELREDATLGVPGLVAAARAGQVGLANPLGTGLAESAAFQAFLPRLASHLLGEELDIPSVSTWWCGEPRSLAYVLEHLDELVIKPAFDERRAPPLEPATLARAEREELIGKMRRRPFDYVAQRWPKRSVAPFLDGDRLSPGHLALRLFSCRSGADYVAMPGGLARVASTPDGLFLFVGGEQASKDVWVPAVSTAGEHALPSMPEHDDSVRREGEDLPSRLLDDLYWLGRCLERVDNIARVVRYGLDRAGDEVSLAAADVEPCVQVLRRLHVLESSPSALAGQGAGQFIGSHVSEEILRAIASPRLDNDLRSNLGSVRSLMQRVRSRLSRDAWYGLQQLSRFSVDLEQGPPREETSRWLDQVLLRVAAVSGGLLENMVRGSAWSFVDMGRRVERGAFVLGLLSTFLTSGTSRSHLEAVLEITDSLLTYRARYLSRLQLTQVVDLLLTDESNPHSVLYQVMRIRAELARLPKTDEGRRTEEERRIHAIEGRLLSSDVATLCSGDRAALRALTDELLEALWSFSDGLSERYFSHAGAKLQAMAVAPVDENLEADWA